ncbi:MAG: NusG-like protein [Gemmataceae bacterium]|nr:NusG-like protein [Gemmataceae bacterium]
MGERLRMGGLESLAPTYQATRRWSDRVKTVELPLFDGYVFCEFAFEQRIQVLRTPGVQSVVGFGGTPACIPAGEIEVVRSILRSGAAAQPWPYLRTGQRVRIVDGCLRGAVGILARERNLCRVVVSIEILQRSVAVEVDRGRLAPA